jgi:DNA-binding MarR family transcriptional regulator
MELARTAGVSASAASQHLKLMREAGLVLGDVDGRRRIYRLSADMVGLVQRAAARLLGDAPEPPQDHPSDALVALARQRARTWPQLDELNMLISFRVERLVSAMHKETQRISAQVGLSVGELHALGAIAALGPPYETSPTELRKALWISLPGVGKRLDLLESRGMVERLPNPDDRRGQVVRLTERGKSALEATGVGTRNPSYRALVGMGREEKLALERTLRHWQEAMEYEAQI